MKVDKQSTNTVCGAVANPNGRLILASSSPRRKDLLEALGLNFDIIASHLEEVIDERLSPPDLVLNLARQKAEDVFGSYLKSHSEESFLVLGADTMVVLDGRFIAKPVDKADACSMLRSLSGKKHQVFTGVFLTALLQNKRQTWQSVECSDVYFRDLEQAEIEAYVETGEPMDKAGAYALQGIGACLVDRVEGSHTNIVGLPIPNVVSLLRQAGYGILGLPNG